MEVAHLVLDGLYQVEGSSLVSTGLRSEPDDKACVCKKQKGRAERRAWLQGDQSEGDQVARTRRYIDHLELLVPHE